MARFGRDFDVVAIDCTTRQRNTHITEEQEVHYPWHPWLGLSVRVHESLVKRGNAVSRCSIDQAGFPSRLEVPQWMFDRICCRSLRLAERPLVNCGALLELKSLLTSADGYEAVLEDQHHFPNEEGDADAKGSELSTCRPTEPVCGELVLKPQQAGDTGLCNDFASGRNLNLQPSVVSSRISHWACHRPTHNGTAGRCRNP